MKKIRFCLLAIVLLFACNTRKEKLSQLSKEDVAFNDTLTAEKSKAISEEQVSSWKELDSIFPAYKITERVSGVVVELFHNSHYMDSIFKHFIEDERAHRIVDSSDQFIFRKHDKLSEYLLQDSPSIYVNGLKGEQKAHFSEVIFHVDECSSSFVVFRFADYDEQKNGPPLMASVKSLNIERCYCEDLNDQVLWYEKNQNYDYYDSLKPRVFAKSDRLVFSYSDDFDWRGRHCLFPNRKIFEVDTTSMNIIWSSGLDLYGIPCD